MRPRFMWDAYDQANYDLSFLCNDPYRSIIQLIGCNSRHGMTMQQVVDNCKVKMSHENLETAVLDLEKQGFIRTELVEYGFYPIGGTTTYYKVNWSVIKQINNAIKRLP